MSPNLKRLFELAKSNMAGPDEFEAPFILSNIYSRHGEALIEALEKLANEASGMNGLVGHEIVGHTNKRVLEERISIARELLSQLEQEAQP